MPAALAIIEFSHEGKANCFHRFELTPNRARVFPIIVRNRVNKLRESQSNVSLRAAAVDATDGLSDHFEA